MLCSYVFPSFKDQPCPLLVRISVILQHLVALSAQAFLLLIRCLSVMPFPLSLLFSLLCCRFSTQWQDVYVHVTNRMWWQRLHHQSPSAINFNTGLTLQANQLAIPPGILLVFLTAAVMITMLMVAVLRAVELLVSRKTWVLNVTTDIMLLHVYSIYEGAAHSPAFVLPCDAIAFSYRPTCCLCIKMAQKDTCYAFWIFLASLSVSYSTWVVVHTEGFES